MSFLDRFRGRSTQATYQRGMHAFNAGHLDEALAAFVSVLDAGVASSDPLVSLSRFYAAEAAHTLGLRRLLQDDLEGARVLFRQALQWNPRFPELQVHSAALHLLGDDHATARALLESALAQNPDHFEARILLAECACREDQTHEATHHLEQARERGPVRELDAAVLRVVESGVDALVTGFVGQHTNRSLRHSV